MHIFVVLSVVLITGGSNSGYGSKSAEIYNPVTNTSCSLPKQPEDRYAHSQDGGLACGGGDGNGDNNAWTYIATSCVKWSPASGTWTQSHTLSEARFNHVSWVTTSGVYLIGGMPSPGLTFTSEKVLLDGSVEKGFSLKDWTGYVTFRIPLNQITRSGVDKVKPKGWFKYSLQID